MNYRKIVAEVYNQPWAILPSKMEEISAVVEGRISGTLQVTAADLDALRKSNAAPTHQPGQNVAVLPLFGTMHQHGSLVKEASGGASTAAIGEQFRKLVADPEVSTIVLHVNSPGGAVYGTRELSQTIFDARGDKKVIASVNSMAASAALWVATAADEVVVTPGGDMGSIGVVVAHQDITGAEERMGVKTTYLATPEKKVQGWQTLDDETIAEIQAENEVIYHKFVADVARNRGVSGAQVVENYGGGGMLNADQCLAVGLCDRIATFEQVIEGILEPKKSVSRSYANENLLALERAKG